MMRRILRRAFYLLLILAGVSVLTFFLQQVGGRDPALAVALRTQGTSEENIARLREQFGLNGTQLQIYLRWISGLLRGDFGYSVYSGHAVAEDLPSRLLVTCRLIPMAFGWILLLGTPMALCAAWRPGSVFDHVSRLLTILGICLPTFWLSYLLLVFFAVKIPLVSVAPKANFSGLLLPSFALAVPSMGSYVRIFRSSLLRQLGKEYCKVAGTRGLSHGQILLSHAVRNALPPVVTMLMQTCGYLFVGTVLVESVFSLEGFGSYLLGCALAADTTALSACLMLSAAFYAVCNLAGEALNGLLCPQMLRGEENS